jgi:nitrate reductase alpha subunit
MTIEVERPDAAQPAGLDGPVAQALVNTRRFFTKATGATVSADGRTLHKIGGREGDSFYRDRWAHDKVVRSTHGVNCTGSCSWKVYVKDGIITWEAQQTDYPSAGPDRPEYEPRGCPRGAAFSWYTYSPTRVRYPYVRGVLLEQFRAAKAVVGDPVVAWAAIQQDPAARAAYTSARGKGGLVRASWDEVVELVAAAHVYTVKRWGPDRIAGFSPIPAMSPVSYASGARFLELIGAPMLSFYDWYADLPNASPQMFGDQTDVPESGDWWDAGYLMMWGSNVPMTRTPDAHWMTEARYRGQKVVAVAPDYAENVKFADEWVPCRPGVDGALAMGMGHVILKEFFADRQVDFFQDYNRRYTDLPFLISLEQGPDAAYTTGKFVVAGDLDVPEKDSENAMWKPVVLDGRTGQVAVPNGSVGFRYGDEGLGKWNLDLGEIQPRLSLLGAHDGTALVRFPRFDAEGGLVAYETRGVPVRTIGGRLVTTVLDLLLAHYGVVRPGLPGTWPTGYADASVPATPAWAAGPRVGAERDRHPGPRDDPHGCGDQPLVPLRPDLPGDAAADDDHRVPGPQRRRVGALCRPGEDPPDHGLPAPRLRPGLAPAAAAHEPDGVLVRQHQPVPL